MNKIIAMLGNLLGSVDSENATIDFGSILDLLKPGTGETPAA